MEIFKLFGSIFIDSSQADQSLSKTEKNAEGLASKLGNSLKTGATMAVGAIAAVGAATAAAGTALFGMANDAAGTTDRIDKLSQKIGMSRQAFQEWDFIASQCGMTVERLQPGFKTMTTQLDSAKAGSEKATEAFKALGFSTEDLSKLSREEIFEKSVAALQNMTDETQKATLANQLFGKAGSEMMPLLNSAAGSVEEMKQKAHELGLVLGDEAIDAGVKFTDTLDQLKRSFGAVKAQIGVAVMPVIQKLMELIVDNMPKIKATLEPIFSTISQFFEIGMTKIGGLASSIGEKLAPAFEKISSWFSGAGIDSATIFSAAFDGIGVIISSVVDAFVWFVGVLDEYVFKNEEVMSIVSDVWTKIQGLFNNALTFIKALIQASIIVITAFWDKWGEDIINIATKAWEFITALLKTSFDLINDLLKVFSALFKGDWEGLWEAVKTLFINLWENIKDLFKQAVDLIIVTLQTFINMYIQHWTNLWNTVKDFFVKLWGDIKEKFAQGVRDVVASAMQLATDIITALKDLPNKALNIANDLIQGLVNGIKNGASKVVQAAKDMARNVWKSITDVFDMRSPSRLAIRVFQKDFAEEGIGAGILKGIPKVVSDTKKLGNSIMDALDTDIGISTSVAGNGVAKGMRATSATSGNVTYNININNPTIRNDSDIKKISQSIYKTIFASNRAEGVI